jgi:hypothetical protein
MKSDQCSRSIALIFEPDPAILRVIRGKKIQVLMREAVDIVGTSDPNTALGVGNTVGEGGKSLGNWHYFSMPILLSRGTLNAVFAGFKFSALAIVFFTRVLLIPPDNCKGRDTYLLAGCCSVYFPIATIAKILVFIKVILGVRSHIVR